MARKDTLILMSIILTVLISFSLSGQSPRGMTLNGATGLISTPTGRIGWESSNDFSIDTAYHAIIYNGEVSHIPKIAVSLFKKGEIAAAFDFQEGKGYTDLIFSGKFQLFNDGTSAVALGGNVQVLNQADISSVGGQVNIAATYSGRFFDMPAETTAVLGKSFGDDIANDTIDFSMGFDLVLLPEVFRDYIHWVNDFANYSYSNQALGANAQNRGAFNTGIRIDPLGGSQIKFLIDAFLTDALDTNRAFTLGATFGIGLK